MALNLEAFSAALSPLEPAPSSRAFEDRDDGFQQHLDRAREQPRDASTTTNDQRQETTAARDADQQPTDRPLKESGAVNNSDKPSQSASEQSDREAETTTAKAAGKAAASSRPKDDDDEALNEEAAAAELAQQALAAGQAMVAVQPEKPVSDEAAEQQMGDVSAKAIVADGKKEQAAAQTALEKQAAIDADSANKNTDATAESVAQTKVNALTQAEAEAQPAEKAPASTGTATAATKGQAAEEVVMSDKSARDKSARAEKADRKEKATDEPAASLTAAPAAAQPELAVVEAAMEVMQAGTSADGSQSRGTSEAASEAAAAARPASGPNAAVQHGAPDPKVLLPEAARAAAHEPAAARVTDADRLRFIQRVSRAFQANGNQDGHLKIRLSPPELGALRLEITVRDGTVNAKLEAETPAAQQLLLENLPVLRERLAQQDIKVERFDIELMDQQGGNASPQSDQQANPDRARRGAASNRAGSSTNGESLTTATERTPRVSSNGRLNVVI